jgi:hypothetical protein
MRISGIVAAAALSVVSLQAHADTSKAWTAAKAGLPADAKVVLGFDVAAIQKTQVFAALFPKLRDTPEVAKLFDTMKDTCKLDPLAVVQGVVMATSTDQADGALYLSVNGLDRAKLADCAKRANLAVAADKAAPAKPPVLVKQDGNISEVTRGDDTAFFGWVGKDVIVVSIHAQDKPSLVKWMGGNGALAKSGLGKSIGKVNTSAAVWLIGDTDKELQPGIAAKRVYGAVTYAKGAFKPDVHVQMASAADAKTIADLATKQLAEVSRNNAQLPPDLVAALKTVTLTTANDELVVKANVGEAELLRVLTLAMNN